MIDAPSSPSSIRIAAVGDLLLTTRPGSDSPGRGLEALSGGIRELFASCDIVLANLECTMQGGSLVATEPRVLTSEAQVQGLKRVGINLVTLANNHAFDAGDEGFKQLTSLLSQSDIAFFGAGMNRADAEQPVVLEIKDIRVALLGSVDASSGMYRFADNLTSGVAPLDSEEICRRIKNLRSEADHVIISPHWGEERFRFPSPEQIEQGHAFIDAGASLVVGHHPHVLQGMEVYQNAPIIYSLGNFLANPVYWDNGDTLTWSRFERTGCILIAEFFKDRLHNVQQIAVIDDGKKICIDESGRGTGYLHSANRLLARGVTPLSYRHEAFRVRTIKPILGQLRWSKLRKIRPGHFRKAFKLLFQGLR
jgi:poly-gamma-glutamate synthesis protein (capsule biosynthesis protein)